jgi:hypothetical protein
MASTRFIYKVLRFRRTGPCVLLCRDRTNRTLPHWSALAANGDPRVPGNTEEPPWIPPNQQSIHPLSE